MNLKKIIAISCIALLGILIWRHRQTPTKDESMIIVGTSADYPPYEFIDTATNTIVGFDIDVINEIAQRLGKTIQIKNMPFTSLIFGLMSGEIDLIAAGLSSTPQRLKFVNFSENYLDNDSLAIICDAQKFNPQNIQDLFGKTVAVNTGYCAEQVLSQYPEINLLRLKTAVDLFLALQTSTADAMVCAHSVAQNILKKIKTDRKFIIVDLEQKSDNCAFAFNKSQPQLMHNVNQALQAIKQDGTLQKLKAKWNLSC